mgnify:CR=1 FL=1
MLRYNKSGHFNIPFGRYKKINFSDLLDGRYEKLLRNTTIHNTSFEPMFTKYNDENNWQGPAIKISDGKLFDVFDLFKPLKITTLKGTNFTIIHPENHFHDADIVYPKIVDECKTHKTSLCPNNSDDEDDANTDEPENIIKNFGEETIVEDWYFDGTKYLLDNNNNVYSNETQEFMGRKIDEFTLDFEATELN